MIFFFTTFVYCFKILFPTDKRKSNSFRAHKAKLIYYFISLRVFFITMKIPYAVHKYLNTSIHFRNRERQIRSSPCQPRNDISNQFGSRSMSACVYWWIIHSLITSLHHPKRVDYVAIKNLWKETLKYIRRKSEAIVFFLEDHSEFYIWPKYSAYFRRLADARAHGGETVNIADTVIKST